MIYIWWQFWKWQLWNPEGTRLHTCGVSVPKDLQKGSGCVNCFTDTLLVELNFSQHQDYYKINLLSIKLCKSYCIYLLTYLIINITVLTPCEIQESLPNCFISQLNINIQKCLISKCIEFYMAGPKKSWILTWISGEKVIFLITFFIEFSVKISNHPLFAH